MKDCNAIILAKPFWLIILLIPISSWGEPPCDNRAKTTGLLYEQMQNPSAEPSVPSQEFLDAQTLSCQASDDFIVPEDHSWLIEEIIITGFFVGEGQNPLPVRVLFYQHNTVLNRPEDLPFLENFVDANYDGVESFHIVIDPFEFPPGHYWLSVQPVMPSNFGQWYWNKQKMPMIMDEAFWRNPENGSGFNCQQWTRLSLIPFSEGQADFNLSFSIFGEATSLGIIVQCPEPFAICEDSPGIVLEGGLPPGGYYSGPGVNNNTFFPSETGPGIFALRYNFPDPCGCSVIWCEFQVEVTPSPEVYAGNDKEIAAGEEVNLSDAFARNIGDLWWTTSGDGVFNNHTILHPTYVPGHADIASGMVELCIHASPMPPCSDTAIDCLSVIIDAGNYPQITCPPDVTVLTDPGSCLATGVNLGEPTIVDPYGLDAVTNNAPDGFAPGYHVVEWIAENIHGMTDNCLQGVWVYDNEPPFIPPMSDIFMENDRRMCGAVAIWQPPVLTDNCGWTMLNSSHYPGGFFPVGITEVTLIATDQHSNETVSRFTVTVTDTEPPHRPDHLFDPPDIIVNNDPGECGAHPQWEPPEFRDNCDDPPHIRGSHAPGDFFPTGTTRVRYTATDSHGNSAATGFEVTVIDVEPPHRPSQLPEPPDIIVNNDPGECGAHPHWEPPEFRDNCDDPPHIRGSHSPGDFFPTGTTRVRYTATDSHGNSAYAGFTVTVIDIEPPTVEKPPDIRIPNEPGHCGTWATWPSPMATDNCGLHSLTGNYEPGDYFCVGYHQVTYVATDSNGNTSATDFIIEVYDEFPPEMTCPDTIKIYTSDPPESVPFDLPEAKPPGGIYSGSGISGSQFHPHIAGIGVHSIVYTLENPTSTCQYECAFIIEVIVATSIHDVRENFLIYPNPTKGTFTIEGPKAIPLSIMIIDMIGKKVKSLTTTLPTEINLTDQPPGIYLLCIQTLSLMHIEKIIIQ